MSDRVGPYCACGHFVGYHLKEKGACLIYRCECVKFKKEGVKRD